MGTFGDVSERVSTLRGTRLYLPLPTISLEPRGRAFRSARGLSSGTLLTQYGSKLVSNVSVKWIHSSPPEFSTHVLLSEQVQSEVGIADHLTSCGRGLRGMYFSVTLPPAPTKSCPSPAKTMAYFVPLPSAHIFDVLSRSHPQNPPVDIYTGWKFSPAV